MQYYTVKHDTYVDRTGLTRVFDMANAPYMTAQSVQTELARFIRRGVAAEVVAVPADLAAKRRAAVLAWGRS